jgi:serine/threonine protein kinase
VIPDELAPGTTIGRYMILSRLGSGAMGVVYAAYDPELDRKVALKLLHPRGGTTLDSRSASCARPRPSPASRTPTSSPSTTSAPTPTACSSRWSSSTARPSAPGSRSRPRPWREVLAIMRKAGEGLAAAHDAGLIHRDFKPDNVLIAHDGRVRVLDFGLARSASDISHRGPRADPAAAAVSPPSAANAATPQIENAS